MIAALKQPSSADWPDAVKILNPASDHPLVLVCDHASNHIPAHYDRLGVEPADLERHIAYDVGAADVTRALAERLGAPAFLGTYSRLLVDLNRPFASPTSMPTISEATRIPGNEALDAIEIAFRRSTIFEPFHRAVASFLDASGGRVRMMVAVHSFTPVFLGRARPWHVGILHQGQRALAARFIGELSADPALVVGENVPYAIERDGDYAIPVHATDRGIAGVLVEIRNDLIRDDAGVKAWADRLGDILENMTNESYPAA